jgi:hypothetical protein
MKIKVEANVFVMPRHFDRFGGLTGSVVEYITYIVHYRFGFDTRRDELSGTEGDVDT